MLQIKKKKNRSPGRQSDIAKNALLHKSHNFANNINFRKEFDQEEHMFIDNMQEAVPNESNKITIDSQDQN
jgi:hypothetical protein